MPKGLNVSVDTSFIHIDDICCWEKYRNTIQCLANVWLKWLKWWTSHPFEKGLFELKESSRVHRKPTGDQWTKVILSSESFSPFTVRTSAAINRHFSQPHCTWSIQPLTDMTLFLTAVHCSGGQWMQWLRGRQGSVFRVEGLRKRLCYWYSPFNVTAGLSEIPYSPAAPES